VSVYARDERNSYIHQLGEGRSLLSSVPENSWMKRYPYGRVKDLDIRVETADERGEGAADRWEHSPLDFAGWRSMAECLFPSAGPEFWPSPLSSFFCTGFDREAGCMKFLFW